MREYRLICFPAVREFDRHIEVYGLGRRMSVEQIGDAVPGHHHAGVPMARGQHAEPAGLQVERGGVAPAGERVQHDGQVVLPALQPVGRVDGDAGRLGREQRPDRRRLVAMGRTGATASQSTPVD